MQNEPTRKQYGEAYERGFHQTVAILRRRGADAELAQELAQRAWVQGFERLSQLKDAGRAVAWVNTIAIRAFLDHVATSRRMTDLTDAVSNVKISPTVNIAAIDLHHALQQCCERQRELIETVLLSEDRTAAEVASDLGISVGAVYHRLSRGRFALRRAMEAV